MFYVFLYLREAIMEEILIYTMGYILGVASMVAVEYVSKKERDKRDN